MFCFEISNDKKALSYKYVDVKGRRVSIASRDKFGYSNLMPTQNEFRHILANMVFREESEESSANSSCAFSVR